LLDGGQAPYLSDTTVALPHTRDFGIRSALNQVDLTWGGFRALLDELQQTPRGDPSFAITLQAIEETSSTLAAQADIVSTGRPHHHPYRIALSLRQPAQGLVDPFQRHAFAH